MHMALSRLLDCTLEDPLEKFIKPRAWGQQKIIENSYGHHWEPQDCVFVCFILPTHFKIEPAHMKNERINKHAMFRAELPVHVFRLEA